MTTTARRRLMRDFKRLQDDPPVGVSGAPTDNNIMLWNAVIFGPHDTPFEDGTFKLTLVFTEEYPNKPPIVRFVSKMFHPNGLKNKIIELKSIKSFRPNLVSRIPQCRDKFFLSNDVLKYRKYLLVYADGGICLDILQNRWSPTYDVSAILTSIQSLLHDPNPNSPANNEAAQLFRENKREYEKRVQQIVQESWLDDSDEESEQNKAGTPK